jgi:N-acetylmuramoyl-L-alanine amidase
MAYSDRELLARIVQCEAGGEGDNGMKAVATVVLNRVNATEGEYFRVSQDGNLRNIIFQSKKHLYSMVKVFF